MEIAIIHTPLVQPPKFKIYRKEKPVAKRENKVKPFYPKTVMPEQPTGYIKQKENDCW